MPVNLLTKLKNELLTPDPKRVEQVEELINELLSPLDEIKNSSDLLTGGQLKAEKCFECGSLTEHQHHVVPRLYGGTKTIPLCVRCHGLSHSVRLTSSQLIKAGILQAKKRGVKIGRPSKYNKEDEERILTYRKDGFSIRKIAEKLNISKGFVQRIVKEYDRGCQETYNESVEFNKKFAQSIKDRKGYDFG